MPIAMPSVARRVGEHDAVGRAVRRRPDQRSHDGRAEDLVVVAVDRAGLGGDVRVREQREQRGGGVGDGAADVVVAVRCGQFCAHPALRAAVVEELGVEVDDDVAPVAHDELPVTGERADVGELDADAIAPRLQRGEVLGRHGDHHALLGLGEPDLPRVETGVLARDEVEVDVGADTLGHLADRRRQPAGAAVGDRRVEVLGADQGVDQQLLDDRVADLHARPGDLAGGGVHRGRRERRAADAVAPGGATRARPRGRRGTGRRGAAGVGAVPMQPANTSGLVV